MVIQIRRPHERTPPRPRSSCSDLRRLYWNFVLLCALCVCVSLYLSRMVTPSNSPTHYYEATMPWKDFKRATTTSDDNNITRLGISWFEWYPTTLRQTTPANRDDNAYASSNGHHNDYDPCGDLPGKGDEGNDGFQALYRVDIPTQRYHTSRILCVLYNATSSDSIRAAYEVYGQRCDNFIAATTSALTSPSPPSKSTAADGQEYSRDILSADESDWENLLRLLRHVLADDFDVLHIATERTLVIPENLRKLIATSFPWANTQDLLYFGGPAIFADSPEKRYCSPGAGYSLNRQAIEAVLKCQSNTTLENTHERLADCLYQENIACANTQESSTAQRYLEFGANYMATWRKENAGPVKVVELSRYHAIHLDTLIWGISNSTVGVHMVDGDMPLNTTTSYANILRRFDAIVRKSCEPMWSERIPRGALDENGKPGYVHDATYIRNNPLQMNLTPENEESGICSYKMGTSVEGESGFTGLQKIKILQKGRPPAPRVMCTVYTHSSSHKHRIEAIVETYGQQCDGFMAASNLTDRRIGAVNILHEGPELYANMWLKVRAIWKYIYDHYLDDFDLFHIGGDDMYIIPENLRYLVPTQSSSIGGRLAWNQSAPLYLGSACMDMDRASRYFCGGGAGYTLNRPALRLLVEQLFPTSACSPHHMAPEEDRKIGDCFRSAGILCANTQDDKGEDRYHHMDADFHARWKSGVPTPCWIKSAVRKAGIQAKEYLGQISEYSVSFHLKDAKPRHFSDRGMRRYHSILYGHCKHNSSTIDTPKY